MPLSQEGFSISTHPEVRTNSVSVNYLLNNKLLLCSSIMWGRLYYHTFRVSLQYSTPPNILSESDVTRSDVKCEMRMRVLWVRTSVLSLLKLSHTSFPRSIRNIILYVCMLADSHNRNLSQALPGEMWKCSAITTVWM